MFKNSQALFVVVAPDVFTIDNTCIESLVSWESTFDKFKRLLTFDKVKTDSIYWQVYKIIVYITNITKVSLNQDLKAFLVSQYFIVQIQEECFFVSSQIFNKCWFIKLDTSSTKFSQFCKDILVGSNKAIDEVFCFHTIFEIRQLKESEWSNHNWASIQTQVFGFLVLIKNLVTSQFYCCCFFKFWNDVMVVGVEPFLHWKSTHIPLFTLVTTCQSKVLFQFSQIQVFHRLRNYVEKEGRIKEVIVMRKVI